MAKKIKKPATVPVETLKFTDKERAGFRAKSEAVMAAAREIKAKNEAVRLAVMADSKAKRVKVPVLAAVAIPPEAVTNVTKSTVKPIKAPVAKIKAPKAVKVVATPAVEFHQEFIEIDEPVKPQPVEGDKPGTARVPKVKKIVQPVKFNADADQNSRITVLEVHLAKLLERLSAEHGGVHTLAAEALRADTKANAQ
jgi:hypothetical protein